MARHMNGTEALKTVREALRQPMKPRRRVLVALLREGHWPETAAELDKMPGLRDEDLEEAPK